MAQLPPGGTAFTTPDPVVWAKLLPDGQDHSSSARDGTRSYQEKWLVYVAAPNTPLSAVRASRRLPADGMGLFAHEVAVDPLLNGTYMRSDPPLVVDSTVAVVMKDVRATRDPQYMEVAVYYEGTTDPTAETPEVSSEEVPYQEHLTFDVNGKPVMNSAFDPLDGGMPSEGFYKRLTITRNLPYSMWNMKKGDRYRKTLNRAAFVYTDQFEDDGATPPTPLKAEPGTVLIDSIREQRMERAKLAGAAASSRYYWRVTVELLVDLQLVRLPDGSRVPRAHRHVVPDAGFQAFLDAAGGKIKKGPITVKGHPVSQPQLLNGKGSLLVPKEMNDITFTPHVRTSANGGLCPDFYACEGSAATFTVPDSKGVRVNDTDPAVTSVEAFGGLPAGASSFSLNPGGGFTLTPQAGFVGWITFEYKPVGQPDETRQSCFVLVGAVPSLLFFDKYRYADWAGISFLLENW